MKQNKNSDGRSSKTNGQPAQQNRPKRQAVPPLDAFDNIPQRRPTNPYDEEISERRATSKNSANSQNRAVGNKPTQTSKNNAQNTKRNTGQNTKSQTNQQAVRNEKKKTAGNARAQEQKNQKKSATRPAQTKKVGQDVQKTGKPAKPKKKPISSAKRRRNRRITAVVLTFLFIAVGIIISVRLIFKIEKFSVVLPEGEEMIYSEQEVEQAFGGTIGEGLFSFDNKTSEEKIELALPYIDTVKIRKKLPNTVEFNITPAHEIFYMELTDGSGGVAVLSSSLKVLKISDSVPENTIYIHGTGNITAVPGTQIVFEEPTKAAALQTVLDCAAQQDLAGVNWIDINNVGGISIRIQNRITILLGSTTDLNEKLKYAMLLITDSSQSELTETDAGTLDVSAYPSGNASFRPGDGSRW